MAELTIIEYKYVCPHCGKRNLNETSEWNDIEIIDENGEPKVATMHYEADEFFIHFYKCEDCKTQFCIKRMHFEEHG